MHASRPASRPVLLFPAIALTSAVFLAATFHGVALGQRIADSSTAHQQQPHSLNLRFGGEKPRPLAMVSGDYDEDGVADLVIGYSGRHGSSISVVRGNPDAITPKSQAGWIAAGRHDFVAPFLQDLESIALKGAPSLMTPADVNGDGHLDIVYASKGSNLLQAIFGTGKGRFQTEMAGITLPGKISALSAYRPGMPFRGDAITVGWESGRGGGISIVSCGAKGLSIEASYRLPGKPTQFTVAQLDSDFIPDTAIVAGGELFLLHGRGAIAGKGHVEKLPVSEVHSVTAGSFFFDRHLLPQLSVLTSDGEVIFLAHQGFDPRPYAPEQIAEQRRRQAPGSHAPTLAQLAGDTGSAPWVEIERHSDRELAYSTGGTPLMLRARMSGSGGDDLVVLNPSQQQRVTISHKLLPFHASDAGSDGSQANPFSQSRVNLNPAGSSSIVAALAMRVSADGRQGLVVLHDGDPSPQITVPAANNTFFVNTFSDNPTGPIDQSDSVRCTSGNAEPCTLRDAITYVNADEADNGATGGDTIMLPAGTYTLTFQSGVKDANSNLESHLEILGPVTIIGSTSGSGTTLDAQQNDTVFSINPGVYGSYNPNAALNVFDTTIENLTIQNGLNQNNLAASAKANYVGGAINWDADGAGNLTLSNVTIANNTAEWGPGGGVWAQNSAGGGSGTLSLSGSTIANNSSSEQGGGIYIASPPVALSVTNSTISSNVASLSVNSSDPGGSNGEGQGGGIYLSDRASGSGTAASSISGSTISANSANGAGGGVATYTGLTLMTSVLNGNSSNSPTPSGQTSNPNAFEGGGFYSDVASPETASTITSTNFLGNSAFTSGGAVAVGNLPATNGNGLQISLSRIYGNTSTNGVSGLASGQAGASGGGTVNAIDNWWGCNSGPSISDNCDKAAQVGTGNPGVLTVAPYAQFLLNATSPTSVALTGSLGLAVTLNSDSSNSAITGAFPAVSNSNYTYSFALSGVTGNSIPNGTFSTTGTGSATLTPTSLGSGTISATFDGQISSIDFSVDQPAVLTSPAPGGTLPGASVTFSWTTGTGVKAYWLYLGTTGPGSANLYNSGSTKSTSVSVTGLPSNGVTIYATLFSNANGVWQPENYTYTESGTFALAAMTSPTPGTKFAGTSATFSWTAGAGATGYWLYLGTTGPMSANVYNSGPTSGMSAAVSGLPTNGVTIYATLFSQINGTWKPVSYTYTESGTYSLAAMTNPAQGSTLSGSTATFTWSPGAGPTMYFLYIGTTGGNSYNVYTSGNLFGTTVTATGIPTNGGELFVTLFSNINGAWQSTHYTYIEAGTPVQAAMTSPTPGSTLGGTSATFKWNTGSGVTAYWLYLGTTGPGSTNLFNSGSTMSTSLTVSGLPANGVAIYATLFSEIDGVWQPANYTYTESGTITLAAITSPTPGTTLPGSAVTFNWSHGAGPTAYWLYLGTTGPKSANLYSSGSLAGTSVAVSGLPTNGVTIYATLFSKINGVWQPVSYTYTAQ